MAIRLLAQLLCILAAVLVAGCGGGNEPVNEGKDVPPTPKKDK